MTINSARLLARLEVTESGSSTYGGPVFSPTMTAMIDLINGTGEGQADVVYIAERTVASGGVNTVDLNGTLKDAFGNNVVAVELVALFLINARLSGVANTTELTLGGGSNPVAGYQVGTIGPIRPGSFVFLGSQDSLGYGPIVATTGDIISVTNAVGASNTFQLGIIARSA